MRRGRGGRRVGGWGGVRRRVAQGWWDLLNYDGNGGRDRVGGGEGTSSKYGRALEEALKHRCRCGVSREHVYF